MTTSNESNASELICHYMTVETAYKILKSKCLSGSTAAVYSKENFMLLMHELIELKLANDGENYESNNTRYKAISKIVYLFLLAATLATKHNGFNMENEKRFCFICFKGGEPERNTRNKKSYWINGF